MRQSSRVPAGLERRGAGPWLSGRARRCQRALRLGEELVEQALHGLGVDLLLVLLHNGAHHLTGILGARRAGLGDDLLDELLRVTLAQLLRDVLTEVGDLGLVLLSE